MQPIIDLFRIRDRRGFQDLYNNAHFIRRAFGIELRLTRKRVYLFHCQPTHFQEFSPDSKLFLKLSTMELLFKV